MYQRLLMCLVPVCLLLKIYAETQIFFYWLKARRQQVWEMSKCHRLYGAFQNNELQSSEKLVFSLIASYISALLYYFQSEFLYFKSELQCKQKAFCRILL